jgi:16S rRNA (guanine966-N2)-methyltransferase
VEKRNPRRKHREAAAPGNFRIIGGTWRSRRLPVPAEAGVRPTPDRVRETVFNWLDPVIAGARCLDLYAGTGALGLEALSRGAARAVFVERLPSVRRQIDASLLALGSSGGETVGMDAMKYLAGPATPFDVVFADPPYGEGLCAPVMARLVESNWLAAGASVYLEHEAELASPTLPAGWIYFRSATAGRVRYHLVRQKP